MKNKPKPEVLKNLFEETPQLKEIVRNIWYVKFFKWIIKMFTQIWKEEPDIKGGIKK